MQNKIKELLGTKNVPENQLRIEIERPQWDHTFLLEAIEWSKRSHDAETQCGAVLVRDKTPLSVGYNGFVRDINDSVLSNKRPYKYPFMLHAEWNAILNCARQGKSTLGATCYITTKPCFLCFQSLWQAGIKRIVHTASSRSLHYNHDECDKQIEALLMLINEAHFTTGNISNISSTPPALVMKFIPKNDVLPTK